MPTPRKSPRKKVRRTEEHKDMAPDETAGNHTEAEEHEDTPDADQDEDFGTDEADPAEPPHAGDSAPEGPVARGKIPGLKIDTSDIDILLSVDSDEINAQSPPVEEKISESMPVAVQAPESEAPHHHPALNSELMESPPAALEIPESQKMPPESPQIMPVSDHIDELRAGTEAAAAMESGVAVESGIETDRSSQTAGTPAIIAELWDVPEEMVPHIPSGEPADRSSPEEELETAPGIAAAPADEPEVPTAAHKKEEVEDREMTETGESRDYGIAVQEREAISDAGVAEGGDVNPLLLEKPQLVIDTGAYLKHLWESNTELKGILKSARSLEKAREEIYAYLERTERQIFGRGQDLHILEAEIIGEAVRVLRDVFSSLREEQTGFSALDCLWKLATERENELQWELHEGFILEFIHLFRALSGKSFLYRDGQIRRDEKLEFLNLTGRDAARKRSEYGEDLSEMAKRYYKKYPSGMEADVITSRKANMRRIMNHFNATKEDWNNYQWQLKNMIRDLSLLPELIELSEEQKEAVKKTQDLKIPVAITPYYLSLMDRKISTGLDHAIRARVIPSVTYAEKITGQGENRVPLESNTSPISHLIRRHPMTALVNPFATSPQSMVYPQRNWEIEEGLDPDFKPLGAALDEIINWLEENPGVGEIVISGGDIAMLSDAEISDLLERIAELKSICGICIETRTPVTLPMRWTGALLNIIEQYNIWGQRHVSILTHFEHPYEISPESLEVIKQIRSCGIEVLNQHMFTIENSRRFELSKLRNDLRLLGVRTIYGLNGIDGDAARLHMVPLARILQEHREEASLLPGITSTDRALMVLPGIGTNILESCQDHRLIMIKPDGSRIYELHPQDRHVHPIDPYYYNDIPIYHYLQEITARGENPRDYKNIWFHY